MSSGSSKAPNGRSAKVSIRFTDEPTSPEKVLKMEKQVSLADVNTRSIFNAHSSLADMKPRSPLTSQASVGEMKPRSPLTGDRIIRSPRSEQRQKLDPSRITTLSEFLNLDDLILLQGALVDREEDSTNPVSIDEFVRIFRHNLKKLKTDEELSRLFCKIDSNSDGFVDWQELVNYFLVEKEHMIGTPPELQGQKLYDNPIFPDPESAKLYHKAPIDRIIQLQSEAGMSSSDRYVTISRDGFIRTWHHHTLKYRNSVDNWRVWDTPIAHAISKSVQPPSIPFSITTSCAPYITDVCYLRPMNKLAIVSMDRSLSFYDPFSLEPLHRIRELPNNCMTIDCYRKGEKTVIFFGDDHGYIHFAPIQHIPALNKNSFRKQRIHSDWITKARYIPKLDQILTSSLDAKMTLCDTDMEVVRTFEGSQKGIYTFEWSLSNKLVASCGFDRLVYLWNPYLSSPVNIIKSNGAPIINLAFNEDDKQLITLSSEKELKIWDIRTYRCLQLIQLQTAFPCDERINSLIYDPYHKGVVLGSLRLTLIKKVEDKSNIVRSHLHPIVSILYSIPFHQLLTVDNEGNICIWDPDTGLKIFQYHESRGGKTNTVIFHKTERRILISGSDGRVKSWNFNNGVLQKEYVTKADTDITSVLHRFEAISKMIIGVTLNQKILVWYDLEDEPGASQPFKQYVCPGTASVLAADYHPPNNLVLGCSDGDVYLMNIDSGFVRHRFSPKDWIIQKPGKVAIESILFFSIEKILYILCSGMDGILRIWAALSGDLIREVDGNHTKGDAIMTMKFDADFQRLITGDTHGCIKVWKFDCKSVDINWNNRIAPLYHWKAHEYAITSIEIIKTNGHIATSSSDLRVSLWTFDGLLIGTFGQSSPWNVVDIKSYHHHTSNLLPLHETVDLKVEEAQAPSQQDELADETKEENVQTSVERQPSFKVDSGGRRILAIHDLTPIPEHVPYAERSKLSSHKSNPTIFQSSTNSGDHSKSNDGAKMHAPRMSVDLRRRSGALTERGKVRDGRDTISVRLPSIAAAAREEDPPTSRSVPGKGRRESNLRVCDELNISPRVVRYKSNSVPEMLQNRITTVTALASKTISRIRDLDENNLPPALKPPVERPHLASLMGKRDESPETLPS